MNAICFYTIVILFSLSACAGDNSPKESGAKTRDASEKPDSSMAAARSEATHKKKELLQRLTGDHSLGNISGFMGANTMIDVYQENGEWQFSGSANEGGMREGFENELTEAQLSRLNSMLIEVRSDLSIGLYCEGKIYFEIPFSETGMIMELDPSREYEKYNVFPGEVTGMNGYHAGTYYLIASDNFPEGHLAPLDITDFIQPDFVLLSLSEEGVFTMHLRLGDCCDNYSYTFK